MAMDGLLQRANPTPLVDDFQMEEYMSKEKLQRLTGADDLDDVTYLEMKVDTTETSLGSFGDYLPSLIQLKLNNSTIATIRDLGTSVRHLQVLWLARCGIEDLDGISCLGNLKELYLAFNDVEDLSPLSMLDTLEVLDMESNQVTSFEQVEFLCLCQSLTNVAFDGNPISQDPVYRRKICAALPAVTILDDEKVTDDDRTDPSLPSPEKSRLSDLTKELSLVSHSIKYDTGLTDDTAPATPDLLDAVDRDLLRNLAARSSYSPGAPGSPQSRPRPKTARRRPQTAIPGKRDFTPVKVGGVYAEDTSSALTSGNTMFQGSLFTILRKRKGIAKEDNEQKSGGEGKEKDVLDDLPDYTNEAGGEELDLDDYSRFKSKEADAEASAPPANAQPMAEKAPQRRPGSRLGMHAEYDAGFDADKVSDDDVEDDGVDVNNPEEVPKENPPQRRRSATKEAKCATPQLPLRPVVPPRRRKVDGLSGRLRPHQVSSLRQERENSRVVLPMRPDAKRPANLSASGPAGYVLPARDDRRVVISSPSGRKTRSKDLPVSRHVRRRPQESTEVERGISDVMVLSAPVSTRDARERPQTAPHRRRGS